MDKMFSLHSRLQEFHEMLQCIAASYGVEGWLGGCGVGVGLMSPIAPMGSFKMTKLTVINLIDPLEDDRAKSLSSTFYELFFVVGVVEE